MMPIKDILAMRPKVPGPPVIVVDEATIEQTTDAGPVCGCQEKYSMIQNYQPFLPGGVNPYKKTQIPDENCLIMSWKNIKLGSDGLLLEKPFAKHACELPKNYQPKAEDDPDDLMFLTPPRYTEKYYQKKMSECPREHYHNCDCGKQK